MILDPPLKRQFQVFLLKLADGSPEGFTTAMGCSAMLLAINDVPVAFESIGDALRSLMGSAAKLTIAAQGTFTAAERKGMIEALSISRRPESCELYFDGGLRVRARFVVCGLDFMGFRNGEAVFDILIESVDGCHVS